MKCISTPTPVLQCAAVCCSVLKVSSHRIYKYTNACVAVCCSVLQCVAVYCSVLQCVEGPLSCKIQVHQRLHCKCVAVCCSVIQCVAVCCSSLLMEYTNTSTPVLQCAELQCVAV